MIYYDNFENMAIIEEVMVLPHHKATKKEKAYRLMCCSLYDDNMIYHLSIHESFEQAYKNMMELSCGSWKEEKPKQKMYMNKECGNILTWAEMVEEGKEFYDLFDDTNCMSWQDYYVECEV